jgi:hypothetical protein
MDEGLKNKAYLEGARLKNAGHDNEVISARLEKQGIPEELIKQVIFNLSVQQSIDVNNQQRPFYNIALFKVGVGVLLAILSAILIPGKIYIPLGLIVSGVVYAILTKRNMKA